MAFQITGASNVYLNDYSGADKKTSKLRFTDLCDGNRGIQRSSVNSSHKELVARKMFPSDDVIIITRRHIHCLDRLLIKHAGHSHTPLLCILWCKPKYDSPRFYAHQFKYAFRCMWIGCPSQRLHFYSFWQMLKVCWALEFSHPLLNINVKGCFRTTNLHY